MMLDVCIERRATVVRGTGRTVPEEGSASTRFPVTSSYTAKISAYLPPKAANLGLNRFYGTRHPPGVFVTYRSKILSAVTNHKPGQWTGLLRHEWSPWNQILTPGVEEVMQSHTCVVVSTRLRPSGFIITFFSRPTFMENSTTGFEVTTWMSS